MHKLIRSIMFAALLSSRTVTVETVGLAKSPVVSMSTSAMQSLGQSIGQDIRLAPRAPVGHRQPQARDIPPESGSDPEHIGEEDRAVDRKLMICRGC